MKKKHIKQGRPLMTSDIRKEEWIHFRVTYKERAELDTARSLMDNENLSKFCKLALSARIKWVLKTKKEKQ